MKFQTVLGVVWLGLGIAGSVQAQDFTPQELSKLIEDLQNRQTYVVYRLAAIKRLEKAKHSPVIAEALLAAAQDETESRDIRSYSIQALGKIKAWLPVEFLSEIIDQRIAEGERPSSYGLSSYFPKAVVALGELVATLGGEKSFSERFSALKGRQALWRAFEAVWTSQSLGYWNTISVIEAMTAARDPKFLEFARRLFDIHSRQSDNTEMMVALIDALKAFKDAESIDLLALLALNRSDLKEHIFYAIYEIAKDLKEKCSQQLTK